MCDELLTLPFSGDGGGDDAEMKVLVPCRREQSRSSLMVPIVLVEVLCVCISVQCAAEDVAFTFMSNIFK
jgi:hypothetical protein